MASFTVVLAASRVGQWPLVARWNVLKLGEALLPLLEGARVKGTDAISAALDAYADTFNEEQGRMLGAKLGLGELRDEADHSLCDDMFALLQATETDYTLFFRGLADVPCAELAEAGGEGRAALEGGAALEARAALEERAYACLRPAHYAAEPGAEVKQTTLAWLRRYAARVKTADLPDEERRRRMNATNPLYVFRNYLAQEAIDALEGGDASLLRALMETLERPFEAQAGRERFSAPRPEWARRRAGCSMLSCSS